MHSDADRGWSAYLSTSDGTAAGTEYIARVTEAGGLTNVAGTLFFSAATDYWGYDHELWASDGTSAGTNLVKEINPVYEDPYPKCSCPSSLTNVVGTLFFSADDGKHGRELWKAVP